MEIEKGIPVPSDYAGPGRRYETKLGGEYPFKHMEVGDSFTVPKERRTAVSVACVRQSKKHGKRFTARKTECGKFVRIWRVE